jgi:acyl-CoA synthetase (AMP-forming)/AMP-acid ligase II
VLRRQAEGPGADGLAFDDGRQRITFAELAERASARAVGLQRRGVRAGDSVALVLSPGMSFVETFWALQLAGAVPCAFNPTLPGTTLERRTALIRPRLVLTDADVADLPAPGTPAAVDRAPTDLALFQFTSGTSGEPRAAMVTHRNVLAYLDATRGIGADDIFVGWVPHWHDLGLMRFVIGSVYTGVPCHLVEPAIRTIPEWLRRIAEVGGTLTAAPDFAYRIATRMVGSNAVDLSTLRFGTIAAEPV